MSLARVLAVVVLLVVGPCGARALAADGSAEAGGGSCGAVPAVGCCDEERLLFCDNGVLRALSCLDRPRCGFRPARGIYDCDTAGSTDPSGATSRECLFGDAGAPAVDARARPDTCGDVPDEGCCAGDVLRYCDRGALREVDCRPNQRCGWRGTGQLYDCGTAGDSDPSGAYPRACSGKAPDLGPLRYDSGAADGDGGGGGGDHGAGERADAAGAPGDGGCGCDAGGSGATTGVALVSALLLAMVVVGQARRRKSCSLKPVACSLPWDTKEPPC